MVANKYEGVSCAVVVGMGWIMLRIDYSRLFWLLFGVFSYENHEGKPRIWFSSFQLSLIFPTFDYISSYPLVFFPTIFFFAPSLSALLIIVLKQQQAKKKKGLILKSFGPSLVEAWKPHSNMSKTDRAGYVETDPTARYGRVCACMLLPFIHSFSLYH